MTNAPIPLDERNPPPVESPDAYPSNGAMPPPIYSDSGGFLIPVLLDGHRWIAIPPGDQLATYLVEEGGHGPG